MTPDSITQQRLHNLHLRGNPASGVKSVIHNLVAVQAQDFAGTKWGLAQRMNGATDSMVEAAFAEGQMLRTHALRPTWHFVTPADIRWLLSLTAPRVLAASASQFRKLELDASVFKRTTRALEKSLKGGHHLTRDELREIFEREGVNTRGDLRMSYIMMHAELHAVVCSGARSGNQFTYALLDERAPVAASRVPADAVAELAARYFPSRGPASLHDFAKWSGLTLAACRLGLEACQANLAAHKINGKEYWSPNSALQKYDGEPVAYLMSIYDEYVSSYKDRSAIGTPELGRKLLAMGNALTGIVVIDGKIAGAWKRNIRKQYVDVTISALRRLTKADRAAVSANAEAYAQFLGLTLQLAFSKLELST